ASKIGSLKQASHEGIQAQQASLRQPANHIFISRTVIKTSGRPGRGRRGNGPKLQQLIPPVDKVIGMLFGSLRRKRIEPGV
ncbi:hypothetical protein AVEN_3302-1, partial [Araneus ventricosus]